MESPQTEVPRAGGLGDDEETVIQEEGQPAKKDDPNQKKQSGLRGSPSSLLREENQRRATLEKARSKQLEKFDEIRSERLSRLTGGPPPPPRRPSGAPDADADADADAAPTAPKAKDKQRDKEKDRGDKAGGKSRAEKDVADVLTEIAVAAGAGAAPGASTASGGAGAPGASGASGALASGGERPSVSMPVRPSQQHLTRGQSSRQFSLLSTRRGSGGESLRGPKYAPTYRMTSKNPFKAWKVYNVLKELLEFECEPKRRYDPVWAAKRCVDLAKDIKGAIRTQNLDRYKFCVKVDIGQKLDEGVCCMARFMWDVDKDDFAFYTRENTYMFVIVSVYAFYYD